MRFLVGFLFIAQSLAANTIDIEPGQNLQIVVCSLRGDTVKQGWLDQPLRIFLKQPLKSGWNKVYINNLQIDSLRPVAGDSGLYQFQLNSVIGNRKLADIFRLSDEDAIPVNLAIGRNLNERQTISRFMLIFDPNQRLRIVWSISTICALLAILTYVFYKTRFSFLKDMSTNDNPPFSLSRSQFAFWTLVILSCYFFIWMYEGSVIEITGDLLILLGISAGTTLSAHYIDNRDRENNKERHQNKKSKGFITDILSDHHGVSVHRLQNVIFTISIGAYVLYSVRTSKKIPDISDGLMLLMGISSGTYLAVKAEENKHNSLKVKSEPQPDVNK